MTLRLISVTNPSIIKNGSDSQIQFLDRLRDIGEADLAVLYSIAPPDCERESLEEIIDIADYRRDMADRLLTQVKARRRFLIKTKTFSYSPTGSLWSVRDA